MAGPVSWLVDVVASNPIPSVLVAGLVVFVFLVYLFFRKTVKEFRRGMEGS